MADTRSHGCTESRTAPPTLAESLVTNWTLADVAPFHRTIPDLARAFPSLAFDYGPKTSSIPGEVDYHLQASF